MPLKRRQTPQEKKQLSLKKDRRNSYGENDKSSRKAIPLQKKMANRKIRRADRLNHNVEIASQVEYGTKLKRRWEKVPDQTLAEHIKMGRAKRRD